MSKEEHDQALKYQEVLATTMCTYGTEYLLQSTGLLNGSTAPLVRTPSRLIIHLYNHCIDWTSNRSTSHPELLSILNIFKSFF
jgi:hypothetical protein